MAPVAHALKGNLQRGVWRTRRTVFMTEDVRHTVVQYAVNVLFVELLDESRLISAVLLRLSQLIAFIGYLRILDGHFDTNDLMLIAVAHNIAIFSHAKVLTDDNLLGLGKVLSHLVNRLVALTLVLIIYIRCADGCRIPRLREAGTDDTTPLESVRQNAEKPLNKRACRYTDAVAKVAIALTTGSIILADLSEIGRTLPVVHLVHHIGHHQLVALLRASCFEISQRRMHHLSSSHIINAPGIGLPVAGGNGV